MLLPHNVPIYERLEEILSNSNLAIIVTATGMGKSYVVKEYLDNHNMEALVVVPSDNIKMQWDEVTTRVTPVTYQWLVNNIDDIIDNDIYDCYIIDEAHHAGAEKWGVPIERLINELDKPVIGLTADPVRYSDGLVDVSVNIWKENVVYGYDLLDALKNKLIPPMIYVYAIFDKTGILDSLPDEVTEELKSDLQYTLDNTESITNILRDNLGDGSHKGIVFVDNIERIDEAVNMISEAFPNDKIWEVHYKKTDKLDQISKFKNVDSGYMVAVNMFNEGVHVPGVDTIIMLRRTFSPSVFFQQIGRSVTSGDGDTKQINVFDFVGNHINLQNIEKRIQGIRELSDFMISSSITDDIIKPGQIILRDYTGDVYDILTKIRKSLSDYALWEEPEIYIINTYFPTEGVEGVLKRLPNRTETAIRLKAKELGLVFQFSNYHIWTIEDVEVLQKYFPEEGYPGVMERLPHRTYESIKHKVIELKLHFKGKIKWFPHEIEVLEKYYPVEGPDGVLKILPYRTRPSIIRKAMYLGIRYITTDKVEWTEDERDVIRVFYPTEGPFGVSVRLPHRTPSMIKAEASRLGVKYVGKRLKKK